MKKKWLLILAMAGVLTMAAACGDKEAAGEEASENAMEFSSEGLVKLGNYKNIEIEAVSVGLSDEDMQGMIDGLRKMYADEKVIEGKTVVETGDVVDIDYVGRKDGVAFDGGTAEGYNLTIGSGQFIAGFEDGLIGKEVGGTYDLNLTFPENYGSAELAGQDVVFTVTVNAVIEEILPEWTDEFVQENTSYGSIAEYEEGTREIWDAYMGGQAAAAKEEQVLTAIIANSEFDCEDQVKAVEESMIAQHKEASAANEMELVDYVMSNYGLTEEEFYEEVSAIANYDVKAPLVVAAVVNEEKMKLTDAEYAEGRLRLAEQYQAESAEAFEEQYGRELIEYNLIYEKALTWLVDQAVEK